jgi:glyceraldehyde-3-phosphate dehydrogenase/erythrose-4-phosphate dehydrogenase
MVKILAWYDNEWGNRLVDLAVLMDKRAVVLMPGGISAHPA